MKKFSSFAVPNNRIFDGYLRNFKFWFRRQRVMTVSKLLWMVWCNAMYEIVLHVVPQHHAFFISR